MAQPSQTLQNLTPIFRLDQPDRLDLESIEAAAAKPQRGAWRHLAGIFDSARKRHCPQFSIEPDTTLWRLRYHLIEGFEEHIISDPSVIIWVLDALQIQLWGDEYHKILNRSTRFIWRNQSDELIITLSVLQTVNGDFLQFDIEPMDSMPPLLDEIGLEAKQLFELRSRLKQRRGMILITSSDQRVLDNALMAINQELVSPERKLLSISERHRFSLPRTIQIDLQTHCTDERVRTWQTALETQHDVLLSNALVPEQFQEPISDRCDQGTMAIQTMRVTRAADAIDLLNASILRRAPMHRAVTSVLNHFPVASICADCAEQAKLTEQEQQWLEQLRTPASENVISWLVDGNAEQFMIGRGCKTCAETGFAKPIAVFNLQHRDEKSNQFPSTRSGQAATVLQRQLMNLAKSGVISLSEVIRVIEST